jgi:hypothetical protein
MKDVSIVSFDPIVSSGGWLVKFILYSIPIREFDLNNAETNENKKYDAKFNKYYKKINE